MSYRTTLITGASSGIGAATARRIAQSGECLLLHARGGRDGSKIAHLEAVANECRKTGADVETSLGDLAEEGVARQLVQQATEHFGRLDRIVSNAGFALSTPIGELSRAELNHSYAVITGAFAELITHALPHLINSDNGRVVAVSSFVVDQVPLARQFPATAAAKGAMQAMAMSFAAQVANEGVTVNCINPGFTRKETATRSALSSEAWEQAAAVTPNKRLATPADIAAAIAFFLSDDASHITGQALRVDGGLSLV
ncbi:MAG: SDR family NAD(P)-dependent oxidoreductase [Granulosicoccus sp.]